MKSLFLLFSALVTLSHRCEGDDPIAAGIERFGRIESYHVTLRARSGNKEEVISYYFRRPGFVRMELIKPFRGALLVYSPLDGKVRLRPFPFLRFFVLTLEPDSVLIRSAGGHRVDESDIGTLLRAASELKDSGTFRVLGRKRTGAYGTLLVEVKGSRGFEVYGINRYLLWLDERSCMPLRAEGYDKEGRLREEVLMDDLELDPHLPDDLFSID